MGIIRDILEKIKRRAMDAKGNLKPGTNPNGREMLYVASLLMYQNQTEIFASKNRLGPNGFLTLSEALDYIIREYLRGDMTEELTCSASWNIPIKEELDEAIRKVLNNHNLLEEGLCQKKPV